MMNEKEKLEQLLHDWERYAEFSLQQHNGFLGCVCNYYDAYAEDKSSKKLACLPAEILSFYQISNGAELFVDDKFGQWGLRIPSLDKLEALTKDFTCNYPGDFQQGDIVIGEFLGDLELLIVRCARSQKDYGQVVVVLPMEQRVDWPVAAPNFYIFIERYFAHFGAKYWEDTSSKDVSLQ